MVEIVQHTRDERRKLDDPENQSGRPSLDDIRVLANIVPIFI
jgi:hypothetical protein